jgi:hypothetical protein
MPSKKALDDIQVSKPDKTSAEPTETKEAPKPKKVAQRPRYERQAMAGAREAMFEDNPFAAPFRRSVAMSQGQSKVKREAA